MRWIRRAVLAKVGHWGWQNRSSLMAKAKRLFGGSGGAESSGGRGRAARQGR